MKLKHLVAAAILGLSATSMAQAEPQTLKFSSFLPATTVNNAVSAKAFMQRAEELSDGELKVELYPGGSLVSGGEVQLKTVMDGVADMAEIPIPYTPGRIQGLDVFELPNLAEDNSDGSLATLDLINNGHIKGLEDLVVLGVLQAGPYYIHTAKEISSLADLRGKKLRVSGQTQAQIVARLGAVPVSNIPANGLAENISRGLIDGALVDVGNLYNFGIGDLVHYHVTNLPLGSFTVMWAMTKARYDSLSPKAKAAIDEMRGTWYTTELGKNMDMQTASVTERLKSEGEHTFIELSDQDLKKAESVLDKVVKSWVDKSEGNADILAAARASLKK
ncbi:TRAP transporter substrate-binding protein [uncultured Cohaesibacter sp.]|uniref:TRAP transporter substrate-binding protein n=1 Tax=uncultured Cohaesibacter sp. TaxID=1002546 RepID=UPI0029C66F73|nr:TRAP transporter substrate-binding protein [uncultured Cohaesibacter sp.]